jgi:glucose/mannose transport system substrate-binding protein
MQKNSKLAIVIAGVVAIALVAFFVTRSGSDSATDTSKATGNLEIFTWWASGGEAAGLEGMTTEFTTQNPNLTFVNASVAGAAGVNAKGVLVSRMEAGNPPDTFQAHAGAELSSYVRANQDNYS